MSRLNTDVDEMENTTINIKSVFRLQFDESLVLVTGYKQFCKTETINMVTETMHHDSLQTLYVCLDYWKCTKTDHYWFVSL